MLSCSLAFGHAKTTSRHNRSASKTAALITAIMPFAVFATPPVDTGSEPSDSRIASKRIDTCLLNQLKQADNQTTVEQLKQYCEQEIARINAPALPKIAERIAAEREEAFDPYVILPHKMNYILPATYTSDLNTEQYTDEGNWSDNLKNTEAKFQLSLKVPIARSIFRDDDQISFGFTLQSWWQVYATDISSPFRETNYQPEIFYLTPLDWRPYDGLTGLMVGLEHQSNGRSHTLSRSWNRAYLNFFYAKDNFVLSFRPWYRLAEDEPSSPQNPGGDDNPDIRDYMGNFELTFAYDLGEYEVVYTGRRNFSTSNSGGELGFTFPLSGRLKGYLQYTHGYGESLIDYNHSQNRFGIGIAMTDLF